MENRNRRIIFCVVGVVLLGIAVGFFKRALFGVDPFQCFMSGLMTIVPISFGTLYVIANAILLLFSLAFDRHFIGFSTFINLFFLGYVAQYTESLLYTIFPDLSFAGRLLCLLIGISVFCFSASLYFVADMGVSTYDAVALILGNTWKLGKFKHIRMMTDFGCVLLGTGVFLISGQPLEGLKAMLGIGTILCALLAGPMIDWCSSHVAEPLLHGRRNNTAGG